MKEEKKQEHQEIAEQQEVLKNTKKNMLVSASAGSGKTYIMIEYVTNLVCDKKVPVKNLLVLTFTKAAATEMKERLLKKLKSKGNDPFVLEQIDALTTANICTIDSFCERMLKKYANLVEIPSNFEIMDENFGQKIATDAFERVIAKFHDECEEDWGVLVESFKNDKSKIKTILLEIEDLLQSLADKEKFVEDNIKNCEEFFENACGYLLKNAKNRIELALSECEKLHVFDFEIELQKQLRPLLESQNLFELQQKFEEYKAPRRPNCDVVGEEVFGKLDKVKTIVSDLQKDLKSLNLFDTEKMLQQKEGKLEKILLQLFEVYDKEEKEIKKALNCLSFGDLEHYMHKLSQKQKLFADISYVFVDEYQDTNKIQEKIVKNIAKNCNFVAVGDAKQGIYGFRNASAEIFLKDLQDFSVDENSSVNFLKSNFRSSQKVLDFVNDIFKVCMTKETTGIDYLDGSMLDGRSEFLEEKAKSVNIDLIREKEVEVEELPYVYSVASAGEKSQNKHEVMLKDILRRISEVVSSQISDKGVLRDCKYSDIAILSRNRDELFNELSLFLQENEIPVISNSRNKLSEEVEILVLINYLKIALSCDDEVALLSVLTSALGGISLEVIAQEKAGVEENLLEIVAKDRNQKFRKFNENLQNFRKNLIIFGIKAAFLQLFQDINYRAYLNLHPQHTRLNLFVEKFLSEISASGFDRDLSGLLNYFENVDIVVSSEATMAENGVLLTTIHNSKGLEYPIVFLIGCDKDVMKEPFKKGYVEINETFGVALKNYDQNSNSEVLSVKMQAIRKQEADKRLAEELMIFYVALTRAKNRLYLFGEFKDSIFEKFNVQECKTYFDFVFYALPQAKDCLKENEIFETENISISKIEDVIETKKKTSQIYKNIEKNPKISEKIENYLNFKYNFEEKENYSLKESVTSLSHKNKENVLEKYSNENISFSSAGVEIGNAYHLALKVLNFAEIENKESLEIQLRKNAELLKNELVLIDKEILLKNILLLKQFTQSGKVVKEKEFIMKDSLCNLIENCSLSDEVIVQGVVDLFVLKEDGVILIDYKFSNSNSEKYLLENYKSQIKLYKNAIENFFHLPVKEAYLLSLKNCKLIKVD